MVYSAADVYYSALTPSASGGQPACAYYMVKDGMDTGTATFALVFNLVAYTAAIFVIGATGFLLRPHLFAEFEFWIRFLVAAGLVAQGVLLAFFVACMRCHKGVLKFGNGVISLLVKIRLMKKPEKWRERLSEEVEKYRIGFEEIKKHRTFSFRRWRSTSRSGFLRFSSTASFVWPRASLVFGTCLPCRRSY